MLKPRPEGTNQPERLLCGPGPQPLLDSVRVMVVSSAVKSLKA
jgi:hypothetical protein